jgi:hypothetical protein
MTHDEAIQHLLRTFSGSSIDEEEWQPHVTRAAERKAALEAAAASALDNARRVRIIAAARARREVELAPLRAEVRQLIGDVGWQRARPFITEILGRPSARPRGPWLRRLGKRNANRILAALRTLPAQGRLPFDAPDDGRGQVASSQPAN